VASVDSPETSAINDEQYAAAPVAIGMLRERFD
jgi:hypothetical protein